MARVAVGMPAYNAEQFIGPAIESILAQTYPDLELVISDNASTDRTAEICKNYSRKDSRVVYVAQETNRGATANYNALPHLARATYFKWHSSNDECSPDLLEKCVAALDSDPDAVLAFPQTFLFTKGPESAEPYDDRLDAVSNDPVQRFLQVIDNMALNNVMNGVTRLETLKATALLREFFFADRNLVAELALHGKLLLVKEASFYRRMDEASATAHKSEKDVLAHFDPSWERPMMLQNWRIFASYFAALLSAPIGLAAKGHGTAAILRRTVGARNHLATDIGEAFGYLFRDLRSLVLGRPERTER